MNPISVRLGMAEQLSHSPHPLLYTDYFQDACFVGLARTGQARAAPVLVDWLRKCELSDEGAGRSADDRCAEGALWAAVSLCGQSPADYGFVAPKDGRLGFTLESEKLADVRARFLKWYATDPRAEKFRKLAPLEPAATAKK